MEGEQGRGDARWTIDFRLRGELFARRPCVNVSEPEPVAPATEDACMYVCMYGMVWYGMIWLLILYYTEGLL